MLISCNPSQGRNNFSRTVGNSQSATPNAGSTIKENLRLTGRFLLTLVTKAADIMGSDNSAQVALGLMKAIIEITNVCCRSSHHALTDHYSRL